jgi:hypothetical protein
MRVEETGALGLRLVLFFLRIKVVVSSLKGCTFHHSSNSYRVFPLIAEMRAPGSYWPTQGLLPVQQSNERVGLVSHVVS